MGKMQTANVKRQVRLQMAKRQTANNKTDNIQDSHSGIIQDSHSEHAHHSFHQQETSI